MTLRSRPGKGSVFMVELPLSDREGTDTDVDADESDDQADGWTGTGETVRGGGGGDRTGTVLVIEDDAVQLEGMGLLLRGWGYAVIQAPGIREACAVLDHRKPPDLVLSDLRLSGPETGIDAIQAVRVHCGHPVPGVIVTGDTDPERLRSVGRSGLPMMHKPCDPVALRRLLSRSLLAGV